MAGLVCHFTVAYFIIVYGRAIAQTDSRRNVTTEERVLSRARPCGFWGGRSDTETDCSPSRPTSVLPQLVSSTGGANPFIHL